jgi:DnaJ-domain-containing protein 1
MNLLSLGKKLWQTARKQGHFLRENVESELKQMAPYWENIKRELRTRTQQFGYQFSYEVRQWLEKELGIPMSQWQSLLGRDTELERAYHTLKLPYGADLAEVKRQWRELLKACHPDRNMQNPQDEAQATHQSQILTAAYHKITKAFEQKRI